MTVVESASVSGRPVEVRQHGGLVTSLAGSGVLMLFYLVLRPYGDAQGAQTPQAAAAFASSWWVVAHVAGALALACYARLTVLVAGLGTGTEGVWSRTLGLSGLVLVLPYFGAETFALHILGAQAVGGDAAALDLVDPIRNQPVAMTMFGVGLLLLALSAVLLALAWRRSGVGPVWAIWPLVAGIVLFLPQFFLPPGGRVAFGVAYAVAAGLALLTLRRDRAHPRVVVRARG